MSHVSAKSARKAERDDQNDPILRMLGVGKHLWADEPGDKFIERLRSEDLAPPPRSTNSPAVSPEGLPETVWRRIEGHQGEKFFTARQLPFTYEVEGPGIWFFRNGRRVNRKLSRGQVEKAIARCPLNSTTEIKDLMDFAYLFALLMDSRIRGQAW
jgi:hypothetical protein